MGSAEALAGSAAEAARGLNGRDVVTILGALLSIISVFAG